MGHSRVCAHISPLLSKGQERLAEGGPKTRTILLPTGSGKWNTRQEPLRNGEPPGSGEAVAKLPTCNMPCHETFCVLVFHFRLWCSNTALHTLVEHCTVSFTVGVRVRQLQGEQIQLNQDLILSCGGALILIRSAKLFKRRFRGLGNLPRRQREPVDGFHAPSCREICNSE